MVWISIISIQYNLSYTEFKAGSITNFKLKRKIFRGCTNVLRCDIDVDNDDERLKSTSFCCFLGASNMLIASKQ